MKIIVIGATGMIGHRMVAELSYNHEVFGISRTDCTSFLKRFPQINISNMFSGIDVLQTTELKNIIYKLNPDIVLNCTGIVKQIPLSKEHINTIEINSLFPHKLANICSKRSFKMIHFSTDCVFDGHGKMYTEKNNTNAVDLYGKSKILGEIGYLDNVLTIRTSTIGREIKPHGGLIEWFLSQKNSNIRGFSKAIYTGFPTTTLARLLDRFVLPHKTLCGIRHMSGPPIDKLSLLTMVNKLFNANVKIASDTSTSIDRSLDSTKLISETKMIIPAWETMINDLLIDNDIYDSIKHRVD